MCVWGGGGINCEEAEEDNEETKNSEEEMQREAKGEQLGKKSMSRNKWKTGRRGIK